MTTLLLSITVCYDNTTAINNSVYKSVTELNKEDITTNQDTHLVMIELL